MDESNYRFVTDWLGQAGETPKMICRFGLIFRLWCKVEEMKLGIINNHNVCLS
jgi:hypothetical protein